MNFCGNRFLFGFSVLNCFIRLFNSARVYHPFQTLFDSFIASIACEPCFSQDLKVNSPYWMPYLTLYVSHGNLMIYLDMIVHDNHLLVFTLLMSFIDLFNFITKVLKN